MMHYFQFHIGDYRSATLHLSNEEDLAYRRLLDMYYDTEKPIPLDVAWVSKRIKTAPAIVRDVLNDMFKHTEDGFIHARCDKEIGVYKGFSTAGKRGAAKRWGTGGDSPPITPPITPPIATNNHKPITNNQTNTYICPPDGELTAPTIAKLPECEHKGVIELYHQWLPTLRKVEVWNSTRQGYLRQRWREVAEELAQDKSIDSSHVLNWWSDFFQHIGKSKFLTGKVNSKDGRAFTADLEWILKPSNFAKIVEGKYHGNH